MHNFTKDFWEKHSYVFFHSWFKKKKSVAELQIKPCVTLFDLIFLKTEMRLNMQRLFLKQSQHNKSLL